MGKKKKNTNKQYKLVAEEHQNQAKHIHSTNPKKQKKNQIYIFAVLLLSSSSSSIFRFVQFQKLKKGNKFLRKIEWWIIFSPLALVVTPISLNLIIYYYPTSQIKQPLIAVVTRPV